MLIAGQGSAVQCWLLQLPNIDMSQQQMVMFMIPVNGMMHGVNPVSCSLLSLQALQSALQQALHVRRH